MKKLSEVPRAAMINALTETFEEYGRANDEPYIRNCESDGSILVDGWIDKDRFISILVRRLEVALNA